MPPESSPGLLDRPARSAGDRAARVRFRRAVALMLMTLVLPGSAQLVAGNRKVGRIAMRIWFVLVAGTLLAVVIGLLWHGFVFWVGTNTPLLGLLRLVLMLLAIGWAALFIDAWRLGQPLTLGSASTAARWSASTACSASPSPAPCCSARTWSAYSAT